MRQQTRELALASILGAVLLFLYDELLRRFARLYRRRKRR